MSIVVAAASKEEEMAMMSCPLCCEEKPSQAFCRLSNKCSHESCRDCCIKWIEKVEASGQCSLPGCPFCRVLMTQEETCSILGRPFQPKVSTHRGNNGNEGQGADLDELTLDWLRDQTQQCPGCGAWIEKVPGGCDLMECLCGYRFCYRCGSQGARCSCTPSHHFFWDNIIDRAASRQPPPLAPTDTETGHIDLRNHIKKRKQKEQTDKIRKQRLTKRDAQARELAQLHHTVTSAIWLFGCPKNPQNGLRILHQVLQRESIKTMRIRNAQDLRREERMLDPTISSCKWLFSCSSLKSGLQMLKTQTSSRVQLVQRRRARKKLLMQRELHEDDATTSMTSARWLFFPARIGQRILKEQLSRRAQKVRIERADARKKQERRSVSGASIAIENGTWLFQRKDPTKTVRQLGRLFLRQNPLDHHFGLRERMRFLEDMEWLDGSSLVRNDEDEKANAINIRLLFLNETEQRMELKEIALHGGPWCS